jgi:hypothetical protein
MLLRHRDVHALQTQPARWRATWRDTVTSDTVAQCSTSRCQTGAARLGRVNC